MCRGEIQFIKRAQQINNFKHFRYGNITPTDLDGCIEYKNKAYVFFEIKYKDKELPWGQKIAIERLVNDTSINKLALAMICEHQVDNPDEQVDVSVCKVRELYLSTEKIWRPPKRYMTAKEMTDLFINKLVDKE